MTKAEKRRRLSAAVKILEERYPDAECALKYGGDPWKLLVMGRLSAQCTDARVNEVCKELFAKFPNAEAMAEGDIAEIERIVKPCGLYRMKADNIKAASKMLITDFGGELPSTMEELLLL
ncbi:MAG: endonuclease III, partial [Clostridia bacterium]|nr:endonuclease III [Clostridia bacterium]